MASVIAARTGLLHPEIAPSRVTARTVRKSGGRIEIVDRRIRGGVNRLRKCDIRNFASSPCRTARSGRTKEPCAVAIGVEPYDKQMHVVIRAGTPHTCGDTIEGDGAFCRQQVL